MNSAPSILDVVALRADLASDRLDYEQVGTVIEQLEDKPVLVGFGDEQGRAYAITPCRHSDLLIPRHVP